MYHFKVIIFICFFVIFSGSLKISFTWNLVKKYRHRFPDRGHGLQIYKLKFFKSGTFKESFECTKMFHFNTLPHHSIYRNTLGIALSVLLYFKIMHASRGCSRYRFRFVTNVFSLMRLGFTYLEIKLNVIHWGTLFSKIHVEKGKILIKMK